MAQKTTIQLDSLSYFFLFVLVLSMLIFANGFYLFACMAVLILLLFRLQQPYCTGVFSLLLIQHSLQIIASVFQANYLGEDINFRSPENDTAILLSLGGITALFLPVIYFQNKLPRVSQQDLRNSAKVLSIEKSMYLYLGTFFFTAILTAVAFKYASITQIIFSLIKIKWLFLLLFGFLCIIKNEKKGLFYIFIVVEFVIGFLSFFSEFKTVFYFLLILYATFIVTINFKHILYASLLGGGLLLFGLVWTKVKDSYRSFLNSGSSQQVVGVSRDEALNKLYDLTSEVDKTGLENSTNAFLDRLQYTYHFAKTIERVPSVIPYQKGDNWSEVLQFTTTPRFLNPNKPTIDNSIKATKYTGIKYMGAKRNVSFSLGYFAECYVDFGYFGMMIPLLLIGLVYGKLYQYFILKASPNLLFNYAVVGSFFMEFYAYEMDATYLIGRLFASILTYWFMIQFVFPIVYDILIKESQKNPIRAYPNLL